jgi:hypothetical protein
MEPLPGRQIRDCEGEAVRRLKVGALAVMVSVALAAAGCSSGSAATGGPGGGVPGGGGVPAGGGAAAAGDISKVDACSLLTPDQIQQALGVAFGTGMNQDSNIVRQCEWDQQGATSLLTVGLDVRAFDPNEWQTVGQFPNAVAVSGLGDAAYKNSPLKGDLSVEYKGYEIDMGIVNFSTKSDAEIDQASVDLMKLVLAAL